MVTNNSSDNGKQYLDRRLVEFALEFKKHPELICLIADAGYVVTFDTDNLADVLTLTASYLGIVLDGVYDHLDVVNLCDTMRIRLYEKRVGLVILTTKH